MNQEPQIERSEKSAALDSAFAQIERKFGKGTIMKLGSGEIISIPVISTGALSLDEATGIGGVPKGRVSEIYGEESSGKTTLALHIIANAQLDGGVAAFIDAEHALDAGYARKLGVNIEELLISQPECGEDALQITEMLVRSNAVDVIVIDSVAALVPRAEINGEMGEPQMGLQARLMSQALRKLTGAIAKSNCSVIFINQMRMKIGVIFGSPKTTTGGRALKFYASLRLEIQRASAIKDGDQNVGAKVRVKIAKNKLAAPFRVAEFDIMYGEGISRSGCLLDMGLVHKIVSKSGSWFSYKETRLGQGRENAKQFLKDNPDIFNQLESEIREVLGM